MLGGCLATEAPRMALPPRSGRALLPMARCMPMEMEDLIAPASVALVGEGAVEAGSPLGLEGCLAAAAAALPRPGTLDNWVCTANRPVVLPRRTRRMMFLQRTSRGLGCEGTALGSAHRCCKFRSASPGRPTQLGFRLPLPLPDDLLPLPRPLPLPKKASSTSASSISAKKENLLAPFPRPFPFPLRRMNLRARRTGFCICLRHRLLAL